MCVIVAVSIVRLFIACLSVRLINCIGWMKVYIILINNAFCTFELFLPHSSFPSILWKFLMNLIN